ncbi:MAG: S8 family serine peptidase [Desulfamplus sp.]|nr:S8 family serine peptidase [Desulfamplus sp.]
MKNPRFFERELFTYLIIVTVISLFALTDVYTGVGGVRLAFAEETTDTMNSSVSYKNSYYPNVSKTNISSSIIPNRTERLGTPRSSDQPNLTPYKPDDWSDIIVVSNTTGATAYIAIDSVIYTTDNVYVNWAVTNDSMASIYTTFVTTLYLDGVEITSWNTDFLESYWFASITDYSIGNLSAGTHTIKIKTDSTWDVSESNEFDNEYTKTITVQPDPSEQEPNDLYHKVIIKTPQTEEEIANSPVVFKDKNFTLSFPHYTPPVDIYIAIYNSGSNQLLFVDSDKALTNDFSPYATATNGNISTSFSVEVDLLLYSLLSDFSDQYSVYWLIAPSNGGDIMQSIYGERYELGFYGVKDQQALFEFDESQIEGNDGTQNIENLLGAIKNQYWVFSTKLTEQEVRQIVSKYPSIIPKEWHKTHGLLIEVNLLDSQYKESLNLLGLEKGIISVDQRIFIGDNINRSFFVPPSDKIPPKDNTSNFYDKEGDNWHLGYIDILDAWKIEAGSEDILIGIIDGGFNTDHDDLIGRFKKPFSTAARKCTTDDEIDSENHGTGVSGAIAANPHNGKGISGINWKSNLVVDTYYDEISAFDNIIKYSKLVKVINNSWGKIGKNPKDCDGNEKEYLIGIAGTTTGGIKFSRDFRRTSIINSDTLFVWAAGNDGIDANTQNGAIHLDGNANISRVNNSIVVASIGKDGKLIHSSDYGSTVDIAAPTEYKSTKRNKTLTLKEQMQDGLIGPVTDNAYYFEASDDSDYGIASDGLHAFNGTSAAAPLVTGVASLIFSLYPDFTPEQVKNIIIDSVKDSPKVTERNTTANGSPQKLSSLNVPDIPILNAGKALQLAKEIYGGGLTSTSKMSNPFPNPYMSKVKISFNSTKQYLEVTGIDWKVKTYQDYNNSWEVIDAGHSDISSIESNIFSGTSTSQPSIIVADITLTDKNDGTKTVLLDNRTSEVIRPYSFSVKLTDSSTKEYISDATITIDGFDGVSKLTNINGSVGIHLEPGTYKVYASHPDYEDTVLVVNVPENGFTSTGSIFFMSMNPKETIITCSESEKEFAGECIAKTCEADGYNCPSCSSNEVLKYNSDGSGYCEVSIAKTCETDGYNCPSCSSNETLKYNSDGSGYCEVSTTPPDNSDFTAIGECVEPSYFSAYYFGDFVKFKSTVEKLGGIWGNPESLKTCLQCVEAVAKYDIEFTNYSRTFCFRLPQAEDGSNFAYFLFSKDDDNFIPYINNYKLIK